MKSIKFTVITAAGLLMATQQVYAQIAPTDAIDIVVPEIDGSGAVIAIGLVAGLVALFREKYFRK